MARSRVGGSTAKLSGKVGDVIYSITRNPDGTFRQMVSANPEERFNPNTDAQARARMTMAMIERAMFTYRDFMGTGFENVDLGTNNVSKFSEINYNTVKYDIETYWDVEDWPDWNYDFPRKGQTVPKDGCFIISQGSLRTNLKLWPIGATDSRRWFGIESNVMVGDHTVRSFLELNGLEPGMQYVAIFFCQGNTPSRSFVAWLMLWTDETVNLNAELNSSNWRNYLKTNSNVITNSYFNNETGQLVHICDQLDAYSILRTGCFGQRLRIRKNNRFLYNTCEMQFVTYTTPQEDWGWKTLWDVKDSWIDNPVPPTPTHRIPLEYQEVEWIRRNSGNRTVFRDFFPPRFASLKFRACGSLVDNRYILYDNTGSWRPLIQCRNNDEGYSLAFSMAGDDGVLNERKIVLPSGDFDGVFEFKRSDNVFIG